MGIFQANTPPTDEPKHLFRPLFPRNPLFPPSDPAPRLVHESTAQSKHLAAVALMNQGDESAFETLYQRHRDWVFRMACRVTGSEHLDLADYFTWSTYYGGEAPQEEPAIRNAKKVKTTHVIG